MKQFCPSAWRWVVLAATTITFSCRFSEVKENGGGDRGSLRGSSSPNADIGILSFNDLGSRVGLAVVTASPLGAANEHLQPPCGASAGQGSDLTYQWTAPAAGSYLFTTSAANFNTFLYAYDSAGGLVGCIPDEASTLVLTLQAGQVLYLVVDTATTPPLATDAFTLNICCGTAPANGTAACTTAGCDFTCNTGYTKCGSNCLNTSTDPNHCGSCGSTCTTPPSSCHGSNGTCSGGTCVYPIIAGTACNDGNACTQSDKCSTSGACAGTAYTCGGTATCDGTGGCTCNAGSTKCGNNCVNTSTDPNHCGSCGKTCTTPPSSCHGASGACSNGTCAYPILAGTTCNDGNSCTQSDQCNTSGACQGTAYTCGGAATCDGSGGCTCNTGYTQCGSTCVNTSTDPNHCGSCGRTCTTPPSSCHGSNGTCSSGTCVYPILAGTACNDGNACTQSDQCNTSGACAGTPYSCGTATCDGTGGCTCSNGKYCNGDCVDTKTDPMNCGRCGTECAIGICRNGKCPCPKSGQIRCSDGTCRYQCPN